MIMDMGNYLPGDILTKTDRASMKYGLELRAPFLNKYIIDFSLHLPASFKITTDTDKKILRKTFPVSGRRKFRADQNRALVHQ